MKIIRGDYKITGQFGQSYDAGVVASNPILKRYPWIDLSRGWNVPHCIALELAPRPYGTVGEIQLPVPSLIEAVGIRDSDRAKYITARINIAGHPLQGLAYQIWHLGEVTVSKGQWLDAGVLAGRVGGQYKFTGSGSGAHTSMTMKDAAGKYIDSQPLWDWQPNIVAAIVAKVEEIIHPQPETPKIPPPVEETPTPPVEPPPSEPQKPAEPSPAKVEPKAGDERMKGKALFTSKTFWFNALALATLLATAFGFGGFQPDPKVLEIGGTVIAIVNIVLRLITKQPITSVK